MADERGGCVAGAAAEAARDGNSFFEVTRETAAQSEFALAIASIARYDQIVGARWAAPDRLDVEEAEIVRITRRAKAASVSCSEMV